MKIINILYIFVHTADISSVVATAMSTYKTISGQNQIETSDETQETRYESMSTESSENLKNIDEPKN